MIHLKQSSGNLVADKRAEYARHYAKTKDYIAATDLMKQALELAPKWAPGWYALGEYLEKTNKPDQAKQAYTQALHVSKDDFLGAGLKISFLENASSEEVPLAYAEALFDDYANRFDASLVNGLNYTAPRRHAAQIFAAAGVRRFGTALDLGCGTGLMAAEVRHQIDYLTGVDLSSAMLAKAKEKALYDALIKADVVSALPQFHGLDLILAADVFIYIANLKPVIDLAAAALAPTGLFVFSVEQHIGTEPWKLRESLRRAHSAAYIESLLRQSELTVLNVEVAPIRSDRGAPVAGLYYLAQKQTGYSPDAA
jgi:predicted TPR repeat methyltransferase